jgi:hypothetical protein
LLGRQVDLLHAVDKGPIQRAVFFTDVGPQNIEAVMADRFFLTESGDNFGSAVKRGDPLLRIGCNISYLISICCIYCIGSGLGRFAFYRPNTTLLFRISYGFVKSPKFSFFRHSRKSGNPVISISSGFPRIGVRGRLVKPGMTLRARRRTGRTSSAR